ncbi:hypothetical protein, partial [Streptomyces narbonensis]
QFVTGDQCYDAGPGPYRQQTVRPTGGGQAHERRVDALRRGQTVADRRVLADTPDVAGTSAGAAANTWPSVSVATSSGTTASAPPTRRHLQTTDACLHG